MRVFNDNRSLLEETGLRLSTWRCRRCTRGSLFWLARSGGFTCSRRCRWRGTLGGGVTGGTDGEGGLKFAVGTQRRFGAGINGAAASRAAWRCVARLHHSLETGANLNWRGDRQSRARGRCWSLVSSDRIDYRYGCWACRMRYTVRRWGGGVVATRAITLLGMRGRRHRGHGTRCTIRTTRRRRVSDVKA